MTFSRSVSILAPFPLILDSGNLGGVVEWSLGMIFVSSIRLSEHGKAPSSLGQTGLNDENEADFSFSDITVRSFRASCSCATATARRRQHTGGCFSEENGYGRCQKHGGGRNGKLPGEHTSF